MRTLDSLRFRFRQGFAGHALNPIALSSRKAYRRVSMIGVVLLLLTTFLQADKKNYTPTSLRLRQGFDGQARLRRASWNIVNPWGNNRYKWGNTGYGSRYDAKVKDFDEDYYYNGFQFDNDVYAFPRYRYTYTVGDE